jgi:NAD(P)-dependent dehydrogenase (short-subunit alcohol dehydrogenase family)
MSAAELPRTPSFRLDGKKAIVTGASVGIGQGAAVALAEAGAEVLLVARRREPLDETVAAMRARGLAARAATGDVTDRAAIRALITREGPFDVAVNNAGAALRQRMLEMTDEALDAMIDLNLRAAFTVGLAVAKGMVASGIKGSIINIGSLAGHRVTSSRAGYAATKHGVEGLTKSMALELGPHGIRTNSICPTLVATPMNASLRANPKLLKATEDMIPLGRIAEVADIMGAVVFLASPAAAMINGASLIIDGGMSVK